jgi:plastocyanin
MRRPLRATLFTLLIAGLALGPWLIANAQDDRVIKIIDGEHFKPPNTNISPGDKLRWRNDGSLQHTATSNAGSPEAFDTGELDGGEESKVFTFTKLGEYRYRCTFHDKTAVFFVVEQEPDFSPSPPPPTPQDLSTARPPDQQAAAPSPSPTPNPSPTPSPSPSPTKSPTPSPTPSESPSPRAAGGESGGGVAPATVVAIIGLVVAAGAGGGLWWYRRTRATP